MLKRVRHSRQVWRPLLYALYLACAVRSAGSGAAAGPLPIGAIQGDGPISPYVGETVTLRGVVTGRLATQNAASITYHTIFVQNESDKGDGDPATADGIAVFLGRRQGTVKVGDEVEVSGRVTEFYGLTEIDDAGLSLRRLGEGGPLPAPVWLMASDLTAPLERYEGMRVGLASARVVGPTQAACSLAVMPATVTGRHAWQVTDPLLQILAETNATCRDFPSLAVGAHLGRVVGPLTYHFDQFKLVAVEPLQWKPAPAATPIPLPAAGVGQISVATLNLENHFDSHDDTGSNAEPKPSTAEIAVRQQGFVTLISDGLACPTLLGIQEVETGDLLAALAAALSEPCGFSYTVTHLDSPDPRGIDVALLSDPRQVVVASARLWRQCTDLATGFADPEAACPAGASALFARPPVLVELEIAGQPLSVMVNHFKSKRGGASATAPWRQAQAAAVAAWVDARLEADRQALLIVMGDFNDNWQSPPLRTLTAPGRLYNAAALVPPPLRYTYIYAGVAELIDGILLSPAARARLDWAGILHAHADFPAQVYSGERRVARVTDHDVMVVRLAPLSEPARRNVTLAPAPTMIIDHRPVWWAVAGILATGALIAWRKRKTLDPPGRFESGS